MIKLDLSCHTQDCAITVTILQRLRLLTDVIFVLLIILLLASRSMHKSSSIKENRFGALLSVNDVEYVTVRVLATVINPKVPQREEYLPMIEDSPKYPESVLNDCSKDENFVPFSRNLRFIDYQNALIILLVQEREKTY